MRQFHFMTMVGSLRRDSASRAVANTLDEIAPDDVQVSTLDGWGDLALYDQDIQDVAIPEQVMTIERAIVAADAVVIVTPEYNFSVPGGLKNLLDWLSRTPGRPFAGKPVAVQTISSGAFGGIRAQYHLRQVLLALDAQVLNKPEIIISNVLQRIDQETKLLRDADTRQHVATQLAALRASVVQLRA